MSFRGRGGFRGGRGGAVGAGGKQRIGGLEMTWDYDPDLTVSSTPSEVFPTIDFPKVRPPTDFEKGAVLRFRALRRRIHEGPFYTGPLGEIGKKSAGEGGGSEEGTLKRKRESGVGRDVDPFEDMPRYTQKYRVVARRLPRFDTREYQLRYFPKELWDTIDPSRKTKALAPRPQQRRRVNPVRLDEAEEDAEQRAENPDDDAVKLDEDEEGREEENLEENFSEDDDEMAADYNAENYFDAGDDDADADDAGGMGDEAYD